MNATRIGTPSGSNITINRELQEKLYTNIALLNIVHEPSTEFKAVFKKDMFAKSNKAAFLHVIHYLLTVLNPQMAKEKLVTWPTGNIINRENKFRKEVLQFLSELNKTYEDADLPVMMSSHLLAPGGHRFIHFMYKLSQLVLFEDLKREYPVELLHKPKDSKNEELNEKVYQNLMKCTQEINNESSKAIDKFYRSFEMFKTEAEKTIEEKYTVHQELKEINEEIVTEESKLMEHKLSDEEVAIKLNEIHEKFKTIEKINNNYNECKNLIGHLKENFDDRETLDLAEALKITDINLRRKLSELPEFDIHELESHLQALEERKKELQQIEKHLKFEQESFVESLNMSEVLLKDILEELKD